MAKHEHVFHALWAQCGPYSEHKGCHYHPCHGQRCAYALVGDGRSCDGKKESHEVKKL